MPSSSASRPNCGASRRPSGCCSVLRSTSNPRASSSPIPRPAEMDPRLLDYYNSELRFLRESGVEFAHAYPRIAARLGMDSLEVADPYVERLIESFAFLAARVQLKLDARHPQFTEHLLGVVYPGFLNPVPACGIAELLPDLKDGSLQAGVTIPRGSMMQTPLGKGERTASVFSTAHAV